MKGFKVQIRKARMSEAKAIYRLLNYFAGFRQLLPRSLAEIYENLQQFFVATAQGKVIGCCALYITWEGLAEVKALAVASAYQKRGLGKRLLMTVIREAKELGVESLFTLTIREDLFQQFGFKRTKKSAFPHKVWTECVKCPYFPDTCIETSLTLKLRSKRARVPREKIAAQFMESAQPRVPSEPVSAPPLPPPPPESSAR